MLMELPEPRPQPRCFTCILIGSAAISILASEGPWLSSLSWRVTACSILITRFGREDEQECVYKLSNSITFHWIHILYVFHFLKEMTLSHRVSDSVAARKHLSHQRSKTEPFAVVWKEKLDLPKPVRLSRVFRYSLLLSQVLPIVLAQCLQLPLSPRMQKLQDLL